MKAPYSFQYELIKEGRKFTKIIIKPFFIPKNRDQELLRKELSKKTSVSWDIPHNYLKLLRVHTKFTNKEIQNNRETIANFFRLVRNTDESLLKLISRSNKVKNPQGYIINAMKSELRKRLSEMSDEAV